VKWDEIHGWFQWRSAQEEAVAAFGDGSRFVEVGNFLGRSLCSLGDLVQKSGRTIGVIGVDTCLGSGPEGPRGKDYHGATVVAGGGTLAGLLHTNVIACGLADVIVLMITDSVTASSLFADRSIAWVHLDARHDYDDVKADIRAWLPKIQAAGWLSGDDYDPIKWPGVVRAVGELLPEAQPWAVDQWRYVCR
jgi:hypothetical protein